MNKSDPEGDSSRPKGQPAHRSKAAPQGTPYLFGGRVKERRKALDLDEWLNEGLSLLDSLGREGSRACAEDEGRRTKQRVLFLLALGSVSLRREEWANAMTHFGQVLTIYGKRGGSVGGGQEMLVRALNGLGEASRAEHDAADYTLDPADLEERDRAKSIARAALGEERWRAAWVRSYRLSTEDEGRSRRWRWRYIPQRRVLAGSR